MCLGFFFDCSVLAVVVLECYKDAFRIEAYRDCMVGVVTGCSMHLKRLLCPPYMRLLWLETGNVVISLPVLIAILNVSSNFDVSVNVSGNSYSYHVDFGYNCRI